VGDDAVWVTFDTAQSRSLLQDQNCLFVPYNGPRDILATAHNAQRAPGILRKVKPSLVVSTGSAVAVSFLPLARLAGIPAAYIESAARADGPSLTGKIVRTVPGVQLLSQYRHWALPPWRYAGSVFDDFAGREVLAPRPIRNVVVTLGTIGYGFRRLVDRVMRILPAACEVTWQVGATDAKGLGTRAFSSIPSGTLQSKMRVADVIIAHAGIGSALASLELGKCPILVPRVAAHAEHVDDHQQQIAEALHARGLAVHRSVESLSTADLQTAARRVIECHRSSKPLGISI